MSVSETNQPENTPKAKYREDSILSVALAVDTPIFHVTIELLKDDCVSHHWIECYIQIIFMLSVFWMNLANVVYCIQYSCYSM